MNEFAIKLGWSSPDKSTVHTEYFHKTETEDHLRNVLMNLVSRLYLYRRRGQ